MKSGTIIDFFGGVRATAFAACAALQFVLLCGMATLAWHRGNRIDTLEAQARTWSSAQDTNLRTIADLKQRNVDLVRAWSDDQNAALAAAERARVANAATNKQLAAALAELGEVYARNPKARAWGVSAVDPAVAGKLPGSAGQN